MVDDAKLTPDKDWSQKLSLNIWLRYPKYNKKKNKFKQQFIDEILFHYKVGKSKPTNDQH